MKKVNALIAILFVLALIAVPASQHRVYTQAGTSWGSTFQVLNLSQTVDAHIYIYYYNQDGSVATMANQPGTTTPYPNPVQDTVLMGTSNTYNPIHAAAGFNGSVMISSDNPVDVVSNISIETPQQALDSYDGVPAGGPTLYFPVAMKGNNSNNSTFTIQNTGGAGTVITVKLTGLPKVLPTDPTYQTITLPTQALNLGGSYTFDLAANVPQLTDVKWIGSITVTVANAATDSIAGVMNVVSTKFPTAFQLGSYNAFLAGSTTVKLPLVYQNNNGNRTSVNCQNLDPTQTVTVTVAYTSGINSSTGLPFPAKASDVKAGIVPNGLANVVMDYNGTTNPKWIGSAVVTASPSVNLACVVNQQKPDAGRISSYLGFNPASASTTVVFPLIQSKNGNPTFAARGIVYTSMNLAFVDNNVHPVTCTFYPASGFSTPAPVTSTNSASPVFSQIDIFGNTTRFVGSAICVSTGGFGMFGVVNQQREWLPGFTPAQRDVLSTYNGFNH